MAQRTTNPDLVAAKKKEREIVTTFLGAPNGPESHAMEPTESQIPKLVNSSPASATIKQPVSL